MNARHHAIVVGSSIAGLLSARVLCDHFDQVTIVERDHLPDGPTLRNGVPQARHLHILLGRGLQIIDELFPGIDAELGVHGAPSLRWGSETKSLGASGWSPIFNSTVRGRTASRAFLEWHIRQRLVADRHVKIIENVQVESLLTTPDKSCVTGIQIRERGGSQAEQTLAADLVVDASGRNSHTPDWLEMLGYPRPEETTVNSFLGYATRWYKQPVNFPPNLKLLLIGSRPPDVLSGGAIMRVENDQFIVTLAGVNKNYPPTDEAGFLDFARNLLSPDIYNLIRDAEPLSDISGYQRTESRIRHFEKLERWPEQLVVIGDAACAFNPIYGQGMTTSAMEAIVLCQCLEANQRSNQSGMAKDFQKKLAKVIETPWLMATGEDLRYPGTIGHRPGWSQRFAQKYINRVIEIIPNDPDIANTFTEVLHLIKPPTILFSPNILLKVLSSFFKARSLKIDNEVLTNRSVSMPRN